MVAVGQGFSPASPKDGMAKRCVLVVDDDPLQRMVLRASFENDGFEVEEAESGEAALERFDHVRPDVVLMDVLMPGIDGLETCRRIRKLDFGARTPVIVVTSMEDEETIKSAYESGATDFVTKPINLTVLLHRVRYMLRTHRILIDFDELTGFPGRAVFLDFLKLLVALSERRQTNVAVLYLDIDDFRRFNETLGRQVGDVILHEVSRRLSTSVRAGDYIGRDFRSKSYGGPLTEAELSIARFGGDEFVVALSDLGSPAEAEAVVDRVSAALQEPFQVNGSPLHLTASIGISLSPTHGNDAELLLHQAEIAKDQAKIEGRNRRRFFSADLGDSRHRRFSLEQVVRDSIERGLFVMHYQPKVDVRSGDVVGMEALTRLEHPDKGLVPPSEFIPIAEESGLILDLGYWSLETACRDTARYIECGMDDLKVAVNLSPAQFKDQALVTQFARILEETGLPPSHVELELTEHLLLEDTRTSLGTLAKLRELGVTVVVDDFGTGYSSLSYLKRFKAHGLKIDQSFIRDMVVDSDDASIVSAIINLGHNLGLTVTAEGVEEHDQLTFLRAYGCDTVQGYLFSAARGFDDFRDWVRDRRVARAPARGGVVGVG